MAVYCRSEVPLGIADVVFQKYRIISQIVSSKLLLVGKLKSNSSYNKVALPIGMGEGYISKIVYIRQDKVFFTK